MRSISTKPLVAIAAAAALTLAGSLAGATAQAAPLGPRAAAGIAAAAETGGATVTPVQYYHHRRHYGYRGYRGYRHHHHNDAGAAIAGGILGMAVGAMIAGSAAQNSNAVQYCASRYRSYDPRSGTYLGYDGYRHPCP
jgi:hypothetical protein